ncbi:MAG: effector-associated domain 2-containing protein [Streptosporangiaceae bacterium]
MFAAAVVAWLVAVLGDRALNGVTRTMLGPPDERALAQALSLAFSVAFDGVPESSRDALGTALQERFAEPPTVVLDGRTRVRTGLIRAIQAQIAPLADPAATPAGRSFFDEIGVDAARVRDDLADVVIRSVEQVGASSPALTPLVTQLNADAILDRVDAVLGQMGAIGQATIQPDGRGSRVGVRTRKEDNGVHSAAVAQRLTDALLCVPAVADDDSRRVVLEMLPGDLRHAIPSSRFPRIHVLGMVNTSWNYKDGLQSLVRAVRLVEGDSLAMEELDAVILDLAGPADGDAGTAEKGG